MHKISEIRNPKFEIRNKLEIQMRKYLNAQKTRFSFSAVLISLIVSDFGFRDSSFPAMGLVPASPGWDLCDDRPNLD
jgi:hypothetical protein